MTSKTKNRILQAARLLFNEEGESKVAMVDIAAVLDISPGNLYYHYHGKEQLIPVLFSLFEVELTELLTVDLEGLGSMDDRWVFTYLLFDKIYQYRCLHELDAIRFDKALFKRRQRLDALLTKRLIALVEQLQLAETDSITASDEEKKLLAENQSLFMFSWVNHGALAMTEQQATLFLQRGVYRMFYQAAAMIHNRTAFLLRCEQLLQQGIA